MDISEHKFEDITDEVRTGQNGHCARKHSDSRKPFSLDVGLPMELVQTAPALREAIFGLHYSRVRREAASREPAVLGSAAVWP